MINEQTKHKFGIYNKNNFLVLPDEETVVGADASDQKKLMMENITKGKPIEIGAHSDVIQTVLFHTPTESLLVGDKSGVVKQYKKKNDSFTMIKYYGDVGVEKILSSAQVGRFAIFGGNNYSLVAIDIKNQTLKKAVPKTSYKSIKSLQICFTKYKKILLSVSGRKPDFYSGNSHIFDVTCMVMDDPSCLKQYPFKDLSEANKTVLVQQRTIKSLEETISRLNEYKYENENYKYKLQQAEIKFRDLEARHESIKIENERIRKRLLDVRPDFDSKIKKLQKKFLIINILRRQCTNKLHNYPNFKFFNKEDQSKIIRDLEKEIEILNDENTHINESLQKRKQIQTRTKIKILSLEAKKKETEKELRSFQEFIQQW